MNERIRELAKQATQQYSPTYYTQEWIQGFAELLVRDVVNKFLESGVMSADGTIPQQILKDYGVK